MKRGNAKKAMALGIAVCMTVTTAVTALPTMQVRAQGAEQTAQGTVTETYSNERLDNGYTRVSAGYTLAAYTGEPIRYRVGDVYSSGDASLTAEYGYGGGGALSVPKKGRVELEIDVPQSAVYYMNFDYLANSESILPVEAGIMVNGGYPFYEMRQQKLESQWTAKPDKVYDSYGNEVVSMPDKVYDWQNKYVQDSTYRYTQPLGIELEQGKNTISIELNEGTLLLGDICLTAKPQVPEYTGSETAAGDGFIEIQAEDFLYRNDSAIHATCEYDPDLYPYQAGNRVMNTVDATSFGEQAYSSTNTNPEHLQVSVNRSRQHLEIMQLLINEQFTPQTGIEVDLSLMPDQTKLVLANASGDSPDVATGVNYSIPFELGIRGALKDLTAFPDFADVAERYNAGLIMPYVIGDKIYALPETMNFQVMFYRKDILDKLGLEVPDTLEDVQAMLPDLQMRGLNFYYPTARTVGMKTFLDTTPILFQSGGALYDGAIDKAVLTSEENVEGFTTLTNLFTIYNLPKDVPNFYQHFRNGDYPIGISDFGNYNMISNASESLTIYRDRQSSPGS